jgi:hypothetical protein
MGSRYVKQLLFSEKLQNANNLATAQAREKISADLESLEF